MQFTWGIQVEQEMPRMIFHLQLGLWIVQLRNFTWDNVGVGCKKYRDVHHLETLMFPSKERLLTNTTKNIDDILTLIFAKISFTKTYSLTPLPFPCHLQKILIRVQNFHEYCTAVLLQIFVFVLSRQKTFNNLICKIPSF